LVGLYQISGSGLSYATGKVVADTANERAICTGSTFGTSSGAGTITFTYTVKLHLSSKKKYPAVRDASNAINSLLVRANCS